MTPLESLESPSLREARETIYGCYEWNPITRVDEVYERSGRIYFVTTATSAWTPPDTLIHRYKGMREYDDAEMGARQILDSDEVGSVSHDGATRWYDDLEMAEGDHGDER